MSLKDGKAGGIPKTEAELPRMGGREAKGSQMSKEAKDRPKANAEGDKKAMIIKDAILETVCGITSVLPVHDIPEFALAGKSNVGKSSLINRLVNRKALARTSSDPGKTRTINYYLINKAFYLVDLPGYGYARVSKEEQERWGAMINRYLESSKALKGVFLLVDSRHEPSANDKMMADWILASGYRPLVIATKSDKLSRNELAKNLKQIRQALGLKAGDPVIAFSAKSGAGKEELLAKIGELLEDEPAGEAEEAED